MSERMWSRRVILSVTGDFVCNPLWSKEAFDRGLILKASWDAEEIADRRCFCRGWICVAVVPSGVLPRRSPSELESEYNASSLPLPLFHNVACARQRVLAPWSFRMAADQREQCGSLCNPRRYGLAVCWLAEVVLTHSQNHSGRSFAPPEERLRSG